MSESDDLPRLPDNRIEKPARKISELKPGERAVLMAFIDIVADERGHVWVDTSARVQKNGVLPGLTLRVERTEKGFILWLDKTVKFKLAPLSDPSRYLPVVELREAEETGKDS